MLQLIFFLLLRLRFPTPSSFTVIFFQLFP